MPLFFFLKTDNEIGKNPYYLPFDSGLNVKLSISFLNTTIRNKDMVKHY